MEMVHHLLSKYLHAHHEGCTLFYVVSKKWNVHYKWVTGFEMFEIAYVKIIGNIQTDVNDILMAR